MSGLRQRLRRLRSGYRRRALVVEASVYLAGAWAVLRVVPFRKLEKHFRKTHGGAEVTGPERDRMVADVSRAIWRAGRALPFEVVCFPRAIAAQIMLRRRRIGTVLYYGAATLPQVGFTAHAWLQDGERGVVGKEQADAFAVLARYPEVDENEVQDVSQLS